MDDTPAREGGFGFIEVLVTVSILSIAFVSILSGLGLLLRSTAEHRQLTQAEALARSAAEYLKLDPSSLAAPNHYVPCTATSAPSYSLSALSGVPSGFSVTVTSVSFWDGVSAYGPACPSGGDQGVQQLTISVVGPGAPSQPVVVVKRDL